MSLLKAIGPPGSVGFLIFAIAAGLTTSYVWPKHRRLGQAWLVAVLGGYLLLSWPPAARWIVDSLPAPVGAVVGSRDELETLIVFDGDNRRGRVRTLEQAAATTGARTIHVLGSRLILREMNDALRQRITHHPAANTREQVAWVRRWTSGVERGRTTILVSRLQAPRVERLVSAADLMAGVIASPLDAELPTSGVWRLVPSYSALSTSRDALYEHAALIYYRWRGWI